MAVSESEATAFSPPPSHKNALLSFQSGEDAFVWGLQKDAGDPWFLADDQAREHRAHVKKHVVCPVPGCGATLTTVARTRRRDGLRHLSDAGGHSRESLDHSNGCAAVQDWLRGKHPRSSVNREEYSSESGERRADVLITGPTGSRVAFEIQYSAITPSHWRTRHESYRRQGIVDVWLWGHRGNNLHLGRDGAVNLTPSQQELVERGLPLLFINPEQRVLAIGTWDHERLADERFHQGTWERGWTTGPYAHLEAHPLDTFEAHPGMGIVSARLKELHRALESVREYNAEQSKRLAAEDRRQELEHERLLQERKRFVSPMQDQIRELLGTVQKWNRSDALQAIVEYLDIAAWARIDSYLLPSARLCLVQWQCVIYFDLIAGRSSSFSVRTAHNAITARGVKMGQPDAFKMIARYLNNLTDNDHLERVGSGGRYSAFKPTEIGAWW